MKLYETAFLIAPNLSEEETEDLIQQMAKIVSEKKGKMINIDKWGKRKLAYLIEKFDSAFYVFFHYKGSPDIPSELGRRFRQKEAIIRYMTVRQEEASNALHKKETEKSKEKTMSEELVPEKEAEPTSPEKPSTPEKAAEPEASEKPSVKEAPAEKKSALEEEK